MRVAVVGAHRASKDEQELLEFYLRGDVKWGPMRVVIGQLYVSQAMHAREADDECERARREGLVAETKPYGRTDKAVVWIRSYSPMQKSVIERDFPNRVWPVSSTTRTLTLDWPEPVMDVDDRLADILAQQRIINDELDQVHHTRIIPLRAEGVAYEDCLRWLEQPDIDSWKIKDKKRLEAINRVPDKLLANPPDIVSIDALVEKANTQLKSFHKEGQVMRDGMRAIVYLGASYGID
jgi:hypothetical protein